MEYFCSNCFWLNQSLSEKKSGDDRLESESHQHRIVPKTRSKTITRTTTTSHKYNMGKWFFFHYSYTMVYEKMSWLWQFRTKSFSLNLKFWSKQIKFKFDLYYSCWNLQIIRNFSCYFHFSLDNIRNWNL